MSFWSGLGWLVLQGLFIICFIFFALTTVLWAYGTGGAELAREVAAFWGVCLIFCFLERY